MSSQSSKSSRTLHIPDSVYTLDPVSVHRGRAVWADNPFIGEGAFVVPIRSDMSIVAGGLTIKDKSNEEIDVNTGLIGRVQVVDSEQFLKFYTSHMGIFFELPKAAQTVLAAVFLAVQDQAKDKAHIFLSHQVAKKYWEKLHWGEPGRPSIPSRQLFSRGLAHLISARFIAPHVQGDSWYWTNPSLIFNGDRVRFVQEYRTRRKLEDAAKPKKKGRGTPLEQLQLVEPRNPF